MRLGLLLFLGTVFLVPQGSESRIVSEYELKNKLKAAIKTDIRFMDWILSKVVFEAKRGSHLNTGMLRVCGIRPYIASSKETTKATMTTKTIKPTIASMATMTTRQHPTIMSTLINLSTANKRRRKWELDLDDGSGSGMMPLQNQIDKEELKFDEEEMMLDDNHKDRGSTEEDGGGHNDRRRRSTTWSMGSYGIFQLSDSHFCDSGYRWSRNLCKTSCTAFLDDDIEDDISCLVESGYWRWLLRHHISLGC